MIKYLHNILFSSLQYEVLINNINVIAEYMEIIHLEMINVIIQLIIILPTSFSKTSVKRSRS